MQVRNLSHSLGSPLFLGSFVLQKSSVGIEAWGEGSALVLLVSPAARGHISGHTGPEQGKGDKPENVASLTGPTCLPCNFFEVTS